MTEHEARQRALDAVDPMLQKCGDRAVIFDESTISKPYGWIFFWDSEKALATNDPQFLLAGNGPIVVLARDGSVHFLPSAHPVERWIAEFERGLV